MIPIRDVLILLLIGLGVAIMSHKYISTKGSGKSRIGRGSGYVDDGRKLLREGRALLRKSVVYAILFLFFGLIFTRILLRLLLY